MLTVAELDVIRAEIASEPETSPAKRLLAHIDQDLAEAKYESMERFVTQLSQDEGFTRAEAYRLYHYMDAGNPIEMDDKTPCPSCNGTGRGTESGCMGERSTGLKCKKCHGNRVITTFKRAPADTRFERVVKV